MPRNRKTMTMRIQQETIEGLVDEADIYHDLLPLDDAFVIELGCGGAQHTRAIAESGRPAKILACEVDAIQHEKNLGITDLPNVTFTDAGAEQIPVDDNSADIVMMFKSMHHVPIELMDTALEEIARVLKPGGLAYISEPIYAGDFNEILKMFHDEKAVREAAFAAVCKAVDKGLFELTGQHFFNTPAPFKTFDEFEQRILGVTHTDHNLSPELYQQVKAKFESYVGADGAQFVMPIRVDLLRQPL